MAEKMFSNGSPNEKTMTRWERRVEKAAIAAKENIAIWNYRIPGHNNLDMPGLEPTSEEEEEKEPEIECAERFYELSVGMDMNSMNGPLKVTDYPKGTFDHPVTEKPKRFGSDSGKQKSKQLMLIESEDSTRISEGRKSEKSVENDFTEFLENNFTEFILKYRAQHNPCFARFPGRFKRGLEPTHEKVEVVFSLPYKPAVESETEDAELEHEGMDLEDSIEDEYDFDDDSDDIEYNEEKSSFDRPKLTPAFIMDAPLMVANSGGDARISEAGKTASGAY